MLDEFRPLNLSDVAKQLGTDPFEIVRLLTQSKSVPESWQFKAEQIDRLRQAAGKK
jgi:hypothetical protein